jgi:hypothetical protein
MTAEQLLEFLEQHISKLPQLMGEDDWRAFQAVLHTSVQQMHEGMPADALEQAVQPIFEQLNRHPQIHKMLREFSESVRPRLSQPPAQTLPNEQQLNQVMNRFRGLAATQGAASTDEKSEAPKRADQSERRQR